MGIFNKLMSWRREDVDDAQMTGIDDADGGLSLPGTGVLLEAVSMALIIADGTGKVVSVNQPALRMLREAESDIQRQITGFSAEAVLGGQLAQLFADPVRQGVVIDTLRDPKRDQVEIGTRTFEILATPVFDTQRERVGTLTEWQDVSEKLRQEKKEAERVFNARRIAAENARIRAALDRVTANVMMADHDNVIVYVNDAIVNMLQEAEGDIRREVPEFSARNLIGKSLGMFQQSGGSQQLLGAMGSSSNSQFTIGGRFFRVFVSPVFDSENKRLGTVIEWKDKTEEVKFEGYVQEAINAAIDGNLGVRIDAANQLGFFGLVGKGMNQILTSFEQVMRDTSEVMSSVAGGNLTRRLSKDYKGSYDQLKRDINSTIERLVEVVTEIRESADKVKGGASEIASGNANLSQRTEEQAASLEETSAAMEQITTTVQQNAANAVQANALARGARETAENGGNVVGKAIAAMQAISDSSKKINDIIGVIDEIAFQTNLLALNAAVEAARAGDQGRGFAVVADEVRNLAGRSATAAKEIKDLIKDSSLKVQEGSELVNQSGETLDEIVTAVKKVNDIVAEISTASDEQSTGLAEINRAVGEMDDMTQQNAALVEEAAAASEALGTQAEVLERLLGFFDTGSRKIESAMRTAPATPAASNWKGSERRGPNRPFSGRRPAETRTATRKAAAAPRAAAKPKVEDEENWTEF